MTGVFMRTPTEDAGTETQGRSGDDRGRDWSDAATSQGLLRYAGELQALGRGKDRFFIRTFRGSVVLLTLILDSQLPAF